MHKAINKLLQFPVDRLKQIAVLMKSRTDIQVKIRNILTANVDNEEQIHNYLNFIEECKRVGISKNDVSAFVYLQDEKEIEKLILELIYLMSKEIVSAFEKVLADENKRGMPVTADDTISMIEMLLPNDGNLLILMREKLDLIQEIVEVVWGSVGEYAAYLTHLYIAVCAKNDSQLPDVGDEQRYLHRKVLNKILDEVRTADPQESEEVFHSFVASMDIIDKLNDIILDQDRWRLCLQYCGEIKKILANRCEKSVKDVISSEKYHAILELEMILLSNLSCKERL